MYFLTPHFTPTQHWRHLELDWTQKSTLGGSKQFWLGIGDLGLGFFGSGCKKLPNELRQPLLENFDKTLIRILSRGLGLEGLGFDSIIRIGFTQCFPITLSDSYCFTFFFERSITVTTL